MDVQKANLTYRKHRKHKKNQPRKITRRLLDLLGKILKEIREMERNYGNAEKLLTSREKGDLDIITKMYRQQKNHFHSKDCRESIPNRNPVHLLRHPYGKRGAVGGQDREENTAVGCLKPKYAHKNVLPQGNYASAV